MATRKLIYIREEDERLLEQAHRLWPDESHSALLLQALRERIARRKVSAPPGRRDNGSPSGPSQAGKEGSPPTATVEPPAPSLHSEESRDESQAAKRWLVLRPHTNRGRKVAFGYQVNESLGDWGGFHVGSESEARRICQHLARMGIPGWRYEGPTGEAND